jgi:hypothetical protein
MGGEILMGVLVVAGTSTFIAATMRIGTRYIERELELVGKGSVPASRPLVLPPNDEKWSEPRQVAESWLSNKAGGDGLHERA